jgi:hypothetical protein
MHQNSASFTPAIALVLTGAGRAGARVAGMILRMICEVGIGLSLVSFSSLFL